MPELTVRTTTPEGTQALAAALVPFLGPGDIVLLSGDLGAGKTAFVQGLARAAGVSEAVTSPTFTLLRSYPTSMGLDLLHADVYRLERSGEIADLGLAELVEDDAFALVEWGERAVGVLGPEHLRVTLTLAALSGDDEVPARLVTIRPSGGTWLARWAAMEAAWHPDSEREELGPVPPMART